MYTIFTTNMRLEICSDTKYTPGNIVQSVRSIVTIIPEEISTYPLSLVIIADSDFQNINNIVTEIVQNMRLDSYVALFNGAEETVFTAPNMLDFSKIVDNPQNSFESRVMIGIDVASKFHSQSDSPLEIILITRKDIEFARKKIIGLNNIPVNLISNTLVNCSDIINITNGVFIDIRYDDFNKYKNSISKRYGYNCKLEIQMQPATRLRKIISQNYIQTLTPKKTIIVNLGSIIDKVSILLHLIIRPNLPQDPCISNHQVLFTVKLVMDYSHKMMRNFQKTVKSKHAQPINNLFIKHHLIAKTLYVINKVKKITDFDKSKQLLDKVTLDLYNTSYLDDTVRDLLKQVKLSYAELYKNKAQMRYCDL